MKEIHKMVAGKSRRPLVTTLLEHVDDQPIKFDVIVSMDTRKLKGPIEEERWLLLEALRDHLDLMVRGHARMKQ